MLKEIQAVNSNACPCEIGGWGSACWRIADCRALSIDMPEISCEFPVLDEMKVCTRTSSGIGDSDEVMTEFKHRF